MQCLQAVGQSTPAGRQGAPNVVASHIPESSNTVILLSAWTWLPLTSDVAVTVTSSTTVTWLYTTISGVLQPYK
jgi:hypothetical protein